MKIVACCRAYNEEKHIKQFCESYQNIADLILVADGGSTDKTVEIAENIPKTKVIHYDVKVECKNGICRNPDGPHIQFLIDHAVEEEEADWIIFQDTDMRPNRYLKDGAREIFRMMDSFKKDFLMLTQIFIWQEKEYFPSMSFQNGEWMQGLWAWRANLGIKIIDKMPHFEFSFDGVNSIHFERLGNTLKIQPPMCYMHYGWENLEIANEHTEYYRKSGLIPGMVHPLKIGGTKVEILDWMVE